MILAGKGKAGLSLGSINLGAFRDLVIVIYLRGSLMGRRVHFMLQNTDTFL